MVKTVFFGLGSALALAATPLAASVTSTGSLPVGTTVDLSGFTTNTVIDPSDQAFLDAGIASITVTPRKSDNVEFYDSGQFGAGRALFGTEAGDLIALDEGPSPDYGSPTFTINFLLPTTAFGLRIADTSDGFATPLIEFFSKGNLVESFLIDGAYDASTEFGFTSMDGFDQVVINTDTDGTGFGFDGVGITDLTVGTAPIPLPAGLPLLISAVFGFGVLYRRGRKA